MSNQLFWDIGWIVVQEAVVMTVLCLAGYYLIRGLFQGLTYLSNASKPQAWAARTATLTHVSCVEDEQPQAAEPADEEAPAAAPEASPCAVSPAPEYAGRSDLVEYCR
jgi:hypothetical protein